jgi:hypothetical protein
MSSQSKYVLRLKYLLSRYGALFVVGLLLLSTIGFSGAALAYATPAETEQVTEQTDEQSFDTTVNTSAAVTGDTTLYESDRPLSNMPVYLLAVSPNVTVSAHTEVPSDRAVEVTQQITIELYATRGDEVFWSEERSLASNTERVTDGSLQTRTTIDIRQIRNGRLRQVQSEVQGVGVLHAKVHVDTVYKTDSYQGALGVTAPMEITNRSYAIDAPRSDERTHTTPVTRTITDSDDEVVIGTPVASDVAAQSGVPGVGVITLPGDSALRGGFGLFALGAALVVWRVYHRLPDRETIKREYDEVRHQDWVSRGRIPESDAYERVPIEEFVDLIDIAIDSDKRVIYDRERDLYAVIDSTTIYQHRNMSDPSGSDNYSSDAESMPPDERDLDAESAPAPDIAVTDGEHHELDNLDNRVEPPGFDDGSKPPVDLGDIGIHSATGAADDMYDDSVGRAVADYEEDESPGGDAVAWGVADDGDADDDAHSDGVNPVDRRDDQSTAGEVSTAAEPDPDGDRDEPVRIEELPAETDSDQTASDGGVTADADERFDPDADGDDTETDAAGGSR